MGLLKLYILTLLIVISAGNAGNAQTFTMEHDTAYGNAYLCPVMGNLYDSITTASSAGPITINWQVVASNFPSDWLPNIGIADNTAMYSNSTLALWNGTSGATHTAYYPPSAGGNFYLSMSTLGLISQGTYWLEVKLTDPGPPVTTKNIWFVISRDPSYIAGTITGASAVCAGSTISLTDAKPGGTWSESNGKATVSGGLVSGASAGTDTISYSATNTCGYTASVTKAITINPLPTPLVTVAVLVLNTSSSYISYQWMLAGTAIPGATSSAYTPVTNGSYAVTVTDGNGCTGTSATVNFNNLGVADISASANDIHIYPNPATTSLTITAAGKINHITIVNLLGQAICNNKYNSEKVQVAIADFPKGVYFVKINGADVRKFVKE